MLAVEGHNIKEQTVIKEKMEECVSTIEEATHPIPFFHPPGVLPKKKDDALLPFKNICPIFFKIKAS